MPRLVVAIVACLAALALPAAAVAQPSFGVHTPGVPFANDVGGIDGLQRALGRRISVVSWFQNWGGGWISSVHPRMIDATPRSGRRPLITWEP